MKKLLVIFFAITLLGCANREIDIAIARHEAIASSINLGDKIENVLPKLNNAMTGLRAGAKKPPEKYIKKGVRVEIYYARSLRQPDGLTTDDEFTPYVFNDGVLAAIGWQSIGGPKTTGQVIQPAPKTTTIINNPPPVIID